MENLIILLKMDDLDWFSGTPIFGTSHMFQKDFRLQKLSLQSISNFLVLRKE